MNLSNRKYILLILALTNFFVLFSQEVIFSVKETTFATSVNDEFAPVYYKNGLVFCSNSFSNTSIQSTEGRLFNLVFVQERDSGNWKSPELFSKEITTILNEGPASFSPDGKTIYYARNTIVEGKFKDINLPSNTMGIYSANLRDGIWTNTKAFPYNSTEYSIGTPALSPDGMRIFFASDMPGGYGGTDIYYSEYLDGNWQKPINLGEEINTSGNESYPFINSSGQLFFASDGLPGFGGKDIFYTLEANGNWQKPIHLERNINSTADDYGLITDLNFEKGFFSSNRKHSHDVYSFKSEMPQFGYCDTIKFKPQCFEFYDDRFTDTLHLKYEWNFGKGVRKQGFKVENCFTQPGNYEVVLTITHKLADSVYQTKTVHSFEVNSLEPACFLSPDLVVKGNNTAFKSVLEGFNQFNIENIYWDFGDGYKDKRISSTYIFKETGTRTISLGIEGKKDSYGRIPRKCVSKEINILEDVSTYANELEKLLNRQSSITSKQNELIDRAILENRKGQEAYFLEFDILTDSLAMIQVDKLEDILSVFSDKLVLVNENEIDSISVHEIKQLAEIFKAYHNEFLTIAIHKNTKGSAKMNLEETQELAKQIEQIFLSNGFTPDRIQVSGYGDRLPKVIAKDKKLKYQNQRIEFILLSKIKSLE
jgi:outer membrane protein OmpA-like peptidoglycan-associated protein